MSVVRALTTGLVGGVAGTLAMDLVWFTRYKRSGGKSSFLEWEFAVGLDSWEDASAPAKVGKLLFETAFHRELPPTRASLTTNVMHWGYGIGWGGLYGVSLSCVRAVRLRQAPLLGALVWLASYVTLPIAGFYKPIWAYDLTTLWQDLSAHLAYGTGVVLVFEARARGRLDT